MIATIPHPDPAPAHVRKAVKPHGPVLKLHPVTGVRLCVTLDAVTTCTVYLPTLQPSATQ